MKESGLLNWLINHLPFELHLPGYNYCGPGTKLQKRLTRGDKGINLLDECCKDHDIAYQSSSALSDRHKADLILMKMARKRATSKDASLGEKMAAHLINKVMLAKLKTGSGLKRKVKISPTKTGAGITNNLKNIIKKTKKYLLKNKPKYKKIAIEAAVAAARELMKDSDIKIPRIIPIPKTGGVLPIFAGLSAAGSLPGGTAGIAKVINEYKLAKKRLQESKRSNEKMKSICIGEGLHLKCSKKGLGLLTKKQTNKKN